MRETQLQKQCLTWLKENYSGVCVGVNIHGGGYCNKGFPDLIVFTTTETILVELKSKQSGYKIQPDQLIWKKRFEKIGIRCLCVKSLDEFQKVINSIVKKEQS